MSERQAKLAIAGIWLVLVLASLFSRSYIPIDEARYVTVAWNMWLRGDFLVPYLNGETYSHKPPLLFWLFNAGWWVFGVNDWWPRLISSFFALGGVFLTMRVARLLWPDRPSVATMAALILFGSMLWIIFSTATMFDMMIAFFTVLGMLGVLMAWRGEVRSGWLMVGIAIGLGLLAKGPTIWLQILPVAVLAPWWGKGNQRVWGPWYAGILGAFAVGAIIVLAWAIPAGMRGGAEYQHAIFWGQTADRMVQSFAHRRPLWWYLPLMPLMLFPWLLWLPTWRALARLKLNLADIGVRYCLAWFVPVFAAFTLISGKQVHYLLPIFPAFALLLARLLDIQAIPKRLDNLFPALALTGFGILLGLLHYVQQQTIPRWLTDISPIGGLVIIAIGVAMAEIRYANMQREVWKLAVLNVAAVLVFYLAVVKETGLVYDMRPISAQLKTIQDTGIPLAHVGKYHGQYQFLGRLTQEPEVVSRKGLATWFSAYPSGKAIVYFGTRYPMGKLQPEYIQAYRGIHVVIIGREAWMKYDGNKGGSKDDGNDDVNDDGIED